MSKSVYLDWGAILSYNRLYNILFGGRGIGKTYGLQKLLIKWFKKYKRQFIWIRRTKEEVNIAKDGFFNKVCVEFPDDVLEVRGKDIYINGELAGCFVNIGQQSANKGNSKLNNCCYIVYDEFCIDLTGRERYVPNTMRKINDLIETFARTNEVKVFILSNYVSTQNPAFEYFSIEFKDNESKWVDNDVYCELLPTSPDLVAMKDKTLLGRITKKYDKEYYNYNVLNKSLTDDKALIKKKPNNATQCMTLTTSKRDIFIFRTRNKLYGGYDFYACSKGQIEHAVHYTFDIEKASESVYFVDKTTISTPVRELANNYKRGRLFFENQIIKNELTENLKTFITY